LLKADSALTHVVNSSANMQRSVWGTSPHVPIVGKMGALVEILDML
jgi:hypothetical protein